MLDVNQLAAAIAFLHDRPELAIRMGNAGRELVRVRWGKVAKEIAAVYADLMSPVMKPESQAAASSTQ